MRETFDEISKKIDDISRKAEAGADILFSPLGEEDVLTAEKELKKCKRTCRVVGTIVFTICVTIIYFHLKG